VTNRSGCGKKLGINMDILTETQVAKETEQSPPRPAGRQQQNQDKSASWMIRMMRDKARTYSSVLLASKTPNNNIKRPSMPWSKQH
jgi:hypothetical protein